MGGGAYQFHGGAGGARAALAAGVLAEGRPQRYLDERRRWGSDGRAGALPTGGSVAVAALGQVEEGDRRARLGLGEGWARREAGNQGRGVLIGFESAAHATAGLEVGAPKRTKEKKT